VGLWDIPRDVTVLATGTTATRYTALVNGSISLERQKRVVEFVLKVQGIKEPAATEKIFDFSPVRKSRADLEAKRWKLFDH
jgi:hypothetical protein